MIGIERATHGDLGHICALDCLVLGDSSRRDFLDNAIKSGQCLVARVDGGVVGFAVLDQSFFGQGYISLLIVHPERRRQGVAAALMRHIESICPTEKLFTSTNESNEPMQRLCETLGFVRSGHIDNLDAGDPEIIFFKRVNGQVV
jgi:ribosomal protein S18 acetylase RimI-like enzyme